MLKTEFYRSLWRLSDE